MEAKQEAECVTASPEGCSPGRWKMKLILCPCKGTSTVDDETTATRMARRKGGRRVKVRSEREISGRSGLL